MDRQIRWSSTRLVGRMLFRPHLLRFRKRAADHFHQLCSSGHRHLLPGEDITETGHVLYRARIQCRSIANGGRPLSLLGSRWRLRRYIPIRLFRSSADESGSAFRREEEKKIYSASELVPQREKCIERIAKGLIDFFQDPSQDLDEERLWREK